MEAINLNECMPVWVKAAGAAVGGWAWSVWGPALPVGAACTAMVMADVWSARRLAARLADREPSKRQQLKFSSARFGRAVRTLIKIYALLAVAALVESAVAGEWVHLTKLAGAVVCFWQGVSILENEAACNPQPWARAAGRWLVDKTSRYLKEDEMPKF